MQSQNQRRLEIPNVKPSKRRNGSKRITQYQSSLKTETAGEMGVKPRLLSNGAGNQEERKKNTSVVMCKAVNQPMLAQRQQNLYDLTVLQQTTDSLASYRTNHSHTFSHPLAQSTIPTSTPNTATATAWQVQPPKADSPLTDRFMTSCATREMHPQDFAREMGNMLGNKQRTYKVNKQIFEEVQRNLPIYTDRMQRFKHGSAKKNLSSHATNSKFLLAQDVATSSDNLNLDQYTVIQQTQRSQSPVGTPTSGIHMNTVEHTVAAQSQLASGNMLSGKGYIKIGRSQRMSGMQGMMLTQRGLRIGSTNQLSDRKQMRSSSINQDGSCRKQVGSPMAQQDVQNLISARNQRRPPGTATGNRARPAFNLNTDEVQQDFENERRNLCSQKSMPEPTFLMSDQFKKAKENQERWKEGKLQKLIMLDELRVELEMNFDMFETQDGFNKLSAEGLVNTELNRDKLTNWGFRYFLNQMDKRELEFPSPDLKQSFLEATWIMRGCLSQFKNDRQMTQTMAVTWKAIIATVDLSLQQLTLSTENAEEVVWKQAQKKYQSQINGLNDRIMTLERQKEVVNGEVKRLSKIVASSSDVENQLNHSVYELLQELDNLKDPRGIAKFKSDLLKIIELLPELDAMKNLQYKTLERSIRLMSKNVKEPDEIQIDADGKRTKLRKKPVVHDAFHGCDLEHFGKGGIVYNNVYGFNASRGSNKYDMDDVTERAVRYAEIIASVQELDVDAIFRSICGDKLTSTEIKLLMNKLAEEITPLIDAQVRAQMADDIKEMIKKAKQKLLASISCKVCGAKIVNADGDGGEKYLETDSDLEIMMNQMKNGVAIVKKKKHKQKRARERQNSDSDYDQIIDKKTGKKTRGKKKADKDLYEIDPITGKVIIDPNTGRPKRNKRRPARKEYYSAGESSFDSADMYEKDPITGQYRKDPKTGERIKRTNSQIYEIDPKTGKPRVDPDTGRPLRRYDSNTYLIDSDTGRPMVDPATGKKLMKKKVNKDEYEIDPKTGLPRLDPNTGRPLRKNGHRQRMNAQGQMESDSETEYEIDPYTGKAVIDPNTGWPVPKTAKPKRRTFAEDDYEIDLKTGQPKIDPQTGRPLKKKSKKKKNGKFVLDSEETDYDLDPDTGKPKIDPKTGWPIPKYELDPKTGKPLIDPLTGKPMIKKRARRGAQDGGTDYEIDPETGLVKLDKFGRPCYAYEIDPATGKPKIDPKTGKPMKKRKQKLESAGETEYELDEKTGKLKIDPKTGKPIAKYEMDLRTGKPKVDPLTGKMIVKRNKKDKKEKEGQESSTYEIDYQQGKYVRDPATGQFQLDQKTGRKIKVKRIGGRQDSSSDSEGGYRGRGRRGANDGSSDEGKKKKRRGKNDSNDKLLTLDGVQELQDNVNKGLQKASISKNIAAKKKTVAEMKNPILDAIKDTLKIGKQKLSKEYFICMKGPQVLALMDNMMCDKALDDLRCEQLPIKDRRIKSFASYMFYTMLMQYGLQTLAVKTLIQLTNGLKKQQETQPFAHLLTTMLGMGVPPLRLDEISIVLRAHLFYKIQQDAWFAEIKASRSFLTVHEDAAQNMETGGWLNVFDLIEELKIALKDDKEICERVLTSIKPDILLKKSDNQKRLSMDYSVLKVTTRIAKIGKTPTWIFEQIDFDKSGTLSPQEILQGCRTVLGVFFSTEEANLFTMYLDSDGSGDVDLEEFVSKLSLTNLHREAHKFQISEVTFIERMLTEWYFLQRREKEACFKAIKKYDENNDGVFQIQEFKAMLKKFEPDIEDKKVISLFKECSSISQNGNLTDAINQEVLYMCFMQYKIKGFGKGFFSEYLYSRMEQIKKDRRKKK